MNRPGLTDESDIPALASCEERELIGYLDGLIANTLAQKASERLPDRWVVEEQPPVDSPLKGSGDPEDLVALGPGREDPELADISLPSGGETPPAGRASMSEELAALFRPTDQPSPQSPSDTRPLEGPAASHGPGESTAEPSVYLRRFLQHAERRPEFARCGIAGLDARLGGGFGAGLHLVTGPRVLERAAFLDTIIWEAVVSDRPVVYYTLREGNLRAWERLVRTLGGLLGGQDASRGALHTRKLGPPDVDTLTRLDAVLQRSVLPFLSLIESIPAHPDTLRAFADDVRARAFEATDQHARMPLVLIDDLERLSFLVRARRPERVLFSLAEVLSADAVPGLITSDLSPRQLDRSEVKPVETTLALEPLPSFPEDDLALVDLRILLNIQTAWTGTIRLVSDGQTGLLIEYPNTAEPEVSSQ